MRAWSAECLREALEASDAGDGERARRWQVRRDRTEERLRSLLMTRADKLDTCGRRRMTVRCGCQELRPEVGCDLVGLCERCSETHRRRWAGRVVEAARRHEDHARRAWGARGGRRGHEPRWLLVTLTHRNADPVEGRTELGEAWRRWYKWLHAELQRKRRGVDDGPTPYVLAWEATDGSARKRGVARPPHMRSLHVHAHVLMLVPFFDWKRARAAWLRACPSSTGIDFLAIRKGASGGASYVAKYVTKGIDPEEFTGKQAGALLAAQYGRRRVSTSAHWWRPKYGPHRRPHCRACEAVWELREGPLGLLAFAARAVFRAQVAKHAMDPCNHRRAYGQLQWEELRPPW